MTPDGDATAPEGAAGPAATGSAAAANPPQGPSTSADSRYHWWRIIGVWFVLSAILDPLFYFLAGPHIPPGTMSSTAGGAQFDFNVLFIIALPVILAVWIYMAYAIIEWRVVPQRPRAGRWSARTEQPPNPECLGRNYHSARPFPVRVRYI